MGHKQYTFTIVRHWDQLDNKKSHYNQGCARLVPRLVDGFDACCRFILGQFARLGSHFVLQMPISEKRGTTSSKWDASSGARGWNQGRLSALNWGAGVGLEGCLA